MHTRELIRQSADEEAAELKVSGETFMTLFKTKSIFTTRGAL